MIDSQVLEDPSNLFIVDFATKTSELSGIPIVLQVTSCLFLGACLQSVSASEVNVKDDTSNALSTSDISKQSLMAMIDSRIGLTRFTDILRRPLTSDSLNASNHSASQQRSGF